MRYLVQRTKHYAASRPVPSTPSGGGSGWLRERMLAARAERTRPRTRVADVRAIHAEAHQKYLGGVVLSATPLFLRSEESTILADKDWHLRWADVITGDLRVEIVPGTHAALLQDEHAEAMAELITKALASAS